MSAQLIFFVLSMALNGIILWLILSRISDLENRQKFNEEQFNRLREVSEGIVKYLKNHT